MQGSAFDFFGIVYAISILRYVFFSGLFFLVFYVINKQRWSSKKLQKKFPSHTDYFREVGYSLFTMVIFAGFAWFVFRSPASSYNLRYDEIASHGWGYWGFSIIAMIFIHDTYFYWTHRAMHHPKIYRYVHLVHHLSRNPSPWAAFAFHPLEAVVEAGIVLLIAFVLPFHSSALLVFLLFMTLYNAYGHLGYEIYPKWLRASFVGRWVNTSTAHNLHHEKFIGNYGLYFLFWDRWMGTLQHDNKG